MFSLHLFQYNFTVILYSFCIFMISTLMNARTSKIFKMFRKMNVNNKIYKIHSVTLRYSSERNSF